MLAVAVAAPRCWPWRWRRRGAGRGGGGAVQEFLLFLLRDTAAREERTKFYSIMPFISLLKNKVRLKEPARGRDSSLSACFFDCFAGKSKGVFPFTCQLWQGEEKILSSLPSRAWNRALRGKSREAGESARAKCPGETPRQNARQSPGYLPITSQPMYFLRSCGMTTEPSACW